MEAVISNIVEITIAGKNVTGDVSPFLSKVCYTDKVEAESDDILLVFEDTANKWQSSWYPQQGDVLSVKIGNADNVLDCGLFEIDEIELEFPPDTMTVKAVAASITQSLRTKNNKAFEKQSLRKIAQYFADKHGLKLIGKTSELQKIEIERKTQTDQTDLSFLVALATDFGLIFSIRGNQLIFMDTDELEKQTSIATIDRQQMNKARFVDKTSQTFAGVSVSRRDVRSNSVKKWEIQPSGKTGEADTLVIHGRVENDTQAQARAKGALKNKNKDKISGSITVNGNTQLVAGVNMDLTGIGEFSGKWQIVASTHQIEPSGGYTTDVTVRKII